MQDERKVPILKVTPEMVEEQISAQLQDLQLLSEIKLDLFYPSDISLVFQLVSPFLRKQKDLHKIEISIEINRNFDFDQTFYLLKDLTKITDLSIILSGLAHFNSQQLFTFSYCFQNYTNLLQLSISIDSNFLDNKAHLFRFYDVYQRNPNLIKLEISLGKMNEKSLLPYSILSGINLLTKLEHFDFKVFESKYPITGIFECLEDQFKGNKCLKELKIFFGWNINTIIVNSDFISINKILNGLKSLESLSIEGTTKNCRINWKEIGFQSTFSSLLNLKHLKLELNYDNSFQVVIETIAEMKQLERVDFNFRIDKYNQFQYDNDLDKLGQSLAQIQSLYSLKINIFYGCQIQFDKLANFISVFHSTKSLKELKIHSSSIIDLNQTINQEQLNQTISNLKAFTFIHASSSSSGLNENILSAIVQAEDLEEIHLKVNSFIHLQVLILTTKLFQMILDNKRKLKDIDVNYLLTYNQKQNDNAHYQLINQLSQNSCLEKIKLFFKEGIQNTFPLFDGISQSIAQLENLKELEIKGEGNFYLNDLGLFHFTEALKRMHKLDQFTFKFQMDYLEMKSFNNFTSSFQFLKKLSCLFLEISSSLIYEDEEQVQFAKHFLFPPEMIYLSLKLEINDLRFKNIEDIYKNISILKEVHYLDINLITTDLNYFDCVNLKNYFSGLKRLKDLEMSFYAFSLLHLVSLFQDLDNLNSIIFVNTYEEYETCKVKASRKIGYQMIESMNNREQDSKIEILQEKVYLSIQNNHLFTEKEFIYGDYDNIKFIFDSIVSVTQLRLRIPANHSIETIFQEYFFSNISCLVNLQQLSLTVAEGNQIGNESLNLLGNSLITLPQLTKLFLKIRTHSNPIDWTLCSDFISCFRHLRNLVVFDLSLCFNEDYVDQINQQTVKSLIQNIQEMKLLTNLKIELKNVELDELCLAGFDKMFSELKENLIVLEFLVKTQSIGNNKQLLGCLSQLINLQSLKVTEFDFKQSKLRKLIRLVDLKEYYENDDEDNDSDAY